jgi:oxalate decarboxylase
VGNAEDAPASRALNGLATRRKALGTIAGGGVTAGLVSTFGRSAFAQDASAPTPVSTPQPWSSTSGTGVGEAVAATNTGNTSPFSYRLGASEPLVYQSGTLRMATSQNIAALSGLSINLLDIAVGGLREIHWHPNASELNYCLEGEGEIGILSVSGEYVTIALIPGSIAFIPIGDAHYIRNTGDTPLRLLIGFSNEAAEHQTFSQVLPWMPDNLLNQTLGVLPGTMPSFPPRGDLAVIPVESPASGSAGEIDTPFSTHLDEVAVLTFDGGMVQPVRTDILPKLDGMTLLVLDIDAAAIREPHWHGNASEFNYCASGTAEFNIVAPTGESWTFVVEPGDVAYVPKNWWHYIASVNNEPVVFLAFFDNVAPSRIDLTSMTRVFPPEVLAASFGADPAVFADLPERDTIVIAGPVVTEVEAP